MYLGLETTLRRVTVPTYDINNAVVDRASEEQVGRAYLLRYRPDDSHSRQSISSSD